jgi:hypothetical protein
VSGSAGAASFWIMRDLLVDAAEANESAYALARLSAELGSWYTIHQLLNGVALVPPALGLAVLASGSGAKYIVGDQRPTSLLGYTVVLGGMFAFCFVLGSKRELLLALLGGCLFYLVNARRPRTWSLGWLGFTSLSVIALVDFARALPVAGIWGSLGWRDLARALAHVGASNESISAHLSLYGIQYFDCSWTYGSSIVSLLASIVPGFLWPSRPVGIYAHYASGVSAIEGQGYTIHHASGWYLNLGVPGLIVGAVVFGWVWAKLYNSSLRYGRPGSVPLRVFSAIAFSTFTGGIPNIMRSGPEAYKSMVFECLVMPVLVLTIAYVRTPRSGRKA